MKNSVLKSILTLIMFTAFLGCSSDSGSDDCTPITCLNGGISTADCGCDCPTGFTGANCSTQVMPTKITITKIKVLNFPNSTPTGNYWDISIPTANNALPDILVTMENSSLTEIYHSTTYWANAISNGTNTFEFTPSTPIIITNVNSSFVLNLYDYDGADSNVNDGIDDSMGFVVFNVYNSTNSFPTTIQVSDTTIPLKFELTLSYDW